MAVAEGAQARAALRSLDERFRPVTMATRQLLPVLAPLEPLFAAGGLGRGSIVAVDGDVATSLALAVAAESSGLGSWVVMVGMPSVGLVAASELGVALDRTALVEPRPGTWAATVAALVDSVDVVLFGPARVRPTDARRLAARARERGAVLMPVAAGWPEAPDVVLTAGHGRWEGLGAGHGHLQARRVRVTATGRREAARSRSVELWLPGPDGGVATFDHPTARSEPHVRSEPPAGTDAGPARLRPVG
ncbi:MAG: hypothetical protein U5K29_09620 [Acidimicrobiales bacterium]|nr:hypothetical protein [Acidimicrobiales bacterium]